MTWVTRAREIPSRRAMAAWLEASPDSRRAFHSIALRRSVTTRGVLGVLGGLGLPRRGGMVLTTHTVPHKGHVGVSFAHVVCSFTLHLSK